ncbi:ATP-binding cassette domain-containing protein [Microbacterium sp. KUDC0406]|uniref:ATP-binding cassette domain-containing protein n=1 Tax=Microbacterium sp. KUDC0406 TaxID=2909588 RepID=UPI002E35B2D1|nr:ATP-binding cassette domain-containing protein [Microbacterium sp. KUDC0406]
MGHGGATRAVDGVTFVLPPGELLCVAGPTGSGKSTLVVALSGAEDPSVRIVGGRAQVCGIDARRGGRKKRMLGALTGFVGQGAGGDLPPRLTAGRSSGSRSPSGSARSTARRSRYAWPRCSMSCTCRSAPPTSSRTSSAPACGSAWRSPVRW